MFIVADNLTASRAIGAPRPSEPERPIHRPPCREVATAGARWLDLNPGFVPMKRREKTWRFLVNADEAACDQTLMLDASDAASLDLALSFCTQPPVFNTATAAPERLVPALDIAAHHGLTVVAATMTNQAPRDLDEHLSLAALIVAEAQARGIVDQRLVLDPMVLLGGETQTRGVLQALRAIGQLFDPPPLTLVSISNLVTASAGQRADFAAAPFWAAAFGAGLGAALTDILNPDLRRMARLCSVLDGRRVLVAGEYVDTRP